MALDDDQNEALEVILRAVAEECQRSPLGNLRRLGRYLGSIPADLRREIRAALLFALDLEA